MDFCDTAMGLSFDFLENLSGLTKVTKLSGHHSSKTHYIVVGRLFHPVNSGRPELNILYC